MSDEELDALCAQIKKIIRGTTGDALVQALRDSREHVLGVKAERDALQAQVQALQTERDAAEGRLLKIREELRDEGFRISRYDKQALILEYDAPCEGACDLEFKTPETAALLSDAAKPVCPTCGGTKKCTEPGPYDDGVEMFSEYPCPDCQPEVQEP